ncbi:hypothetical protein R1flu_025693 [Riccia fluitans]|uniref:Uncharacterized protein n=1 Tax=Riccia fluitans TaxID=41844 RepID=A0ABD1XYH1_9MARC
MGIISTILTLCGIGVGVVLGLLAGFIMFIYFEPDDVKVGVKCLADCSAFIAVELSGNSSIPKSPEARSQRQ